MEAINLQEKVTKTSISLLIKHKIIEVEEIRLSKEQREQHPVYLFIK